MAPSGRVAVRIGVATWHEEVERFAPRSPSRAAAERERRRLEHLYLAFVAFGERHPRPGTRSVYERAHKRLHGRYPDQ